MTYNRYDGITDYYPPYLSDYTEKEINLLKRIHYMLFGNLTVVDPLGVGQIYAIMYDELPYVIRKLFFKTKFITFRGTHEH